MALGLQLLHLRQLALSPGKLRFSTRCFLTCVIKVASSPSLPRISHFSTECLMALESPQPRANQGGHPNSDWESVLPAFVFLLRGHLIKQPNHKTLTIKSVMPSNRLILCHPLLLLFSVFPSIRVFSSEPVLCVR